MWQPATALRSTELGYRAIVLSTDAAQGFSDSFEVSLGNELVDDKDVSYWAKGCRCGISPESAL